jgi:hypothetical protein
MTASRLGAKHQKDGCNFDGQVNNKEGSETLVKVALSSDYSLPAQHLPSFVDCRCQYDNGDGSHSPIIDVMLNEQVGNL